MGDEFCETADKSDPVQLAASPKDAALLSSSVGGLVGRELDFGIHLRRVSYNTHTLKRTIEEN